MRAVVQRVNAARVEVNGRVVGKIDTGLCVFVGAAKGDTDADIHYLVRKLVHLRIFTDATGKMSLSLKNTGGAILAISQFTVLGDVRNGRRPGFASAMPPHEARAVYRRFVAALRAEQLPIETGRFGADMRVYVDNDGPVTILLDSRKLF
ncbi:MAG TPA: D-tyrosyl-tRNA(Tyr) deacylase [Sorangium sp.]|nr:D-tyrosyl-tRNA(Tyr) deacylase [Sorangium sp.]